MPNNLVFNEVANQLKTQIYGNNGGTATAVSVDGSGNIATRLLSGATDSVTIAGTVTVTTDTVTITAENLDIRDLTGATDSVTVYGTVTVTTDTVTVTAENLDIRDLTGATDSVTVYGTVTVTTDTVTVTAENLDIRDLTGATDSVTVYGTVTVTTDTVTITATNLDIRDLSAATDSVLIGGNLFTESTQTITTGTGAANIMLVDTSQQSIYSFYVKNSGDGTVTAKLQISPTDTSSYFIDDSSGEVAIASGSTSVLVAQKYLKYVRLNYDTGVDTANMEVYYNAHV